MNVIRSIIVMVAVLGFLADATRAASGDNAPSKVFDSVDLIELNHFYDEQGRLVFDQIIYYDWCHDRNRYQVRDWRLVQSDSQVPLRDWRDGGYVSEWDDFKQRHVTRIVRAKVFRVTWTTHDPELIEREFLSQENRVELTVRAGP